MVDIVQLIQNNPRTGIIVLSFLATLFITIVNYFLTDREKMKEIKQRQKDLRKQMKEVKNDPEKVMELNKKMLEDFPEQMKHMYKPLLVTMIPILIFFNWLRGLFVETSISGSWFWWYLVSAILFSIVIRKGFGLQ